MMNARSSSLINDRAMTAETAWWEGQRGEWYVVIQTALFMLVVFGPSTLAGFPAWISPYRQIALVGGYIFLSGGLLFVVTGAWEIRSHITPLPFPRENARLVQSGPYAIVRHPIYCGAIFMAFGWALMTHGWLTLVYAVVLFGFFDIKSRREERWLHQKFPAYDAYRVRVHRLIPFLY